MKKIPLSRGKFALVDDDDFDRLSAWKWYCSQFGYAVRTKNRKMFNMHRDVLGISEISGRITQTDHINGDKLDNRKENLRRCSPAQNQGNRWKSKQAKTSKYKGVYFCSKLRKFVAYGREGKKNKRLGTFQSEEDAALAYDRWAIGYFGEFARLNFQRWIPTEEEKERMTQ